MNSTMRKILIIAILIFFSLAAVPVLAAVKPASKADQQLRSKLTQLKRKQGVTKSKIRANKAQARSAIKKVTKQRKVVKNKRTLIKNRAKKGR